NYAFGAALNVILSALSALMFYDVIGAFFDRFNLPEKVKNYKPQILFISVAALLFHPLIVYYEIKNVHPFASYMFFMNLGLWMMVKYFKKSTWLNLTLYALVMSLVILARSTFVAILLPCFFWMLKDERFGKTVVKMTYLALIGSLFTLIWTWHIYLKVRPAPIMPNNGIVMWMGSLPQTE